jgi:uncharacterized membrane protein
MHEIRVTVPEGRGKDVGELAMQAGIREVAIYPVFAYGPNCTKETVSAQTSTPLAKKFADSVLASPWFDSAECTVSSRQLRALVTGTHPREITQPMLEPPINVFEDLWQLSHITVSYLAHGMVKNDPVAIVIAALFLPFLSQAVAVGFGMWAGDFSLAKQGIKALIVSTAASVLGGVIVGFLHGPPMLFDNFAAPLSSFALSAVIGVTAGFTTADDAGRRYLIGVAAAVQYGVFPVWFGFCLATSFPQPNITTGRLETFAINVGTIMVFALIGYLLLNIKRRDVSGFVRQRRKAEQVKILS